MGFLRHPGIPVATALEVSDAKAFLRVAGA
jgi:hypothetical protein